MKTTSNKSNITVCDLIPIWLFFHKAISHTK